MNLRNLWLPGNVSRVVFIIILFLLIFSSGCGRQTNVSAVDPLAKEYFEALKNDDLDKVLNMYSADFYKQVPREVWREKLQRLTAELGPIKSYSFRNKQADSRFSGEFYIYQYDTVHSGPNGTEKRAKHTVTFIQPVSSNEIKIAGHMIKAPRFD